MSLHHSLTVDLDIFVSTTVALTDCQTVNHRHSDINIQSDTITSKSTVSPIYSTSKSTASQRPRDIKINGQSEIPDIKSKGKSETQGRQIQRSVKDPGTSKATVSWRYKDTKGKGHSEKQDEKKINGQSHSVLSPNKRWVVFF